MGYQIPTPPPPPAEQLRHAKDYFTERLAEAERLGAAGVPLSAPHLTRAVELAKTVNAAAEADART